VIDSREREVHRRWLPGPLDLQMTLEVPGGVIAPPGISDRHPGLGPSGEPGTIGADMLAVRVPGPGRQRRPLQISRVALDRRRDRLVAGALLVSGRRFHWTPRGATGIRTGPLPRLVPSDHVVAAPRRARMAGREGQAAVSLSIAGQVSERRRQHPPFARKAGPVADADRAANALMV
jgi:hypothetical protein